MQTQTNTQTTFYSEYAAYGILTRAGVITLSTAGKTPQDAGDMIIALAERIKADRETLGVVNANTNQT